jgi:uridine kinase
MKRIFIGISGGSGAGKSTLCHSLLTEYPDQINLIQLDGYFNSEDLVTELEGMKNWDHPDAMNFDRLYADLFSLKEGRSVIVPVKDESKKKSGDILAPRIMKTFEPKEIILVEGYLVMHDPRIRELFETSIWLDIDQSKSWERRVHFKKDGYLEKVLLPMNEEFVQQSKQYVKHVIDVTDMKKEEVFEQVQYILDLKKPD